MYETKREENEGREDESGGRGFGGREAGRRDGDGGDGTSSVRPVSICRAAFTVLAWSDRHVVLAPRASLRPTSPSTPHLLVVAGLPLTVTSTNVPHTRLFSTHLKNVIQALDINSQTKRCSIHAVVSSDKTHVQDGRVEVPRRALAFQYQRVLGGLSTVFDTFQRVLTLPFSSVDHALNTQDAYLSLPSRRRSQHLCTVPFATSS